MATTRKNRLEVQSQAAAHYISTCGQSMAANAKKKLWLTVLQRCHRAMRTFRFAIPHSLYLIEDPVMT